MRPTGNERGLCALPLRLDLDKEFLFPSQKSKPKQEAVTLRERAEVTIIWLDCLMQRSGSSHGGNVLCSQKDGWLELKSFVQKAEYRVGDLAQWQIVCLASTRSWVRSLVPQKEASKQASRFSKLTLGSCHYTVYVRGSGITCIKMCLSLPGQQSAGFVNRFSVGWPAALESVWRWAGWYLRVWFF